MEVVQAVIHLLSQQFGAVALAGEALAPPQVRSVLEEGANNTERTLCGRPFRKNIYIYIPITLVNTSSISITDAHHAQEVHQDQDAPESGCKLQSGDQNAAIKTWLWTGRARNF